MSGPAPLPREDVERTRLPLERASQLPAAAFTDPEVLAWEVENVFAAGWVCAAHVDQVREKGQFVTVQIGGDNVMVVADDDGLPRAFLNSCRHRGARILDAPEGQVPRLRCPYHAWTYGFDGALRSAPFTDDLEGFNLCDHGLEPVRVAVVEGLVLLDLSGTAPAPDLHIGGLEPLLARYRTGSLKRAGREVYTVQANWKVIAENYSECLHCPGVHPELNMLSHYLSGETITGAGAWCGGSMVLSDGAETMATGDHDPTHPARPPIDGLTEQDVRSVLYFVLFPNALVSLHPDYVMLHTLWPRGVDETEVICEFFFEERTIAAEGFDPTDAIQFWDKVNREDWHVCRLAQLGMSGRHYRPGRYTTQEDDVHAFDLMVADRYAEGAPRTAEVPA